MSEMSITRADYQIKRRKFLAQLVDIDADEGLEIGACDLPTVTPDGGRCEFADWRSKEEVIKLWGLPPETVVPVTYILDRNLPVDRQICKQFDYIVACHVLEHIPNPIGYIKELARLLKPCRGVLVLSVPDKRATLDALRPSTTLEHLLSDYYEDCRYPTVEHILEFGKYWSTELAKVWESSRSAAFEWACGNHRSGQADAHCHVWTDDQFFLQIELLAGDILREFSVVAKQATPPGYNEFTVALRVG